MNLSKYYGLLKVNYYKSLHSNPLRKSNQHVNNYIVSTIAYTTHMINYTLGKIKLPSLPNQRSAQFFSSFAIQI